MKAWHFFGDTLRDGTSVPNDRVKLSVNSEMIDLCEYGLHASLEPFDALKYAPGNNLALVELGGKIIKGGDKLVASERMIIKRIDATDLLWQFACECALDVIHLWDAAWEAAKSKQRERFNRLVYEAFKIEN